MAKQPSETLRNNSSRVGDDLQPRLPWLEQTAAAKANDRQRTPFPKLGVSFSNMGVSGVLDRADYHLTFLTYFVYFVNFCIDIFSTKRQTVQILHSIEGYLRSGEMLLVLGRPGSGCSTFLKVIAGDTRGYSIHPSTCIHYAGIDYDTMHSRFRGDCIYSSEHDVHYPDVTVEQTLSFAAKATVPRNLFLANTATEYSSIATDAMKDIFNLRGCSGTKIGDEVNRGVSGGEKKRISLAEVLVGLPSIQCWDSSTSGLDSKTASQFTNTLRTYTRLHGSTALASVYQASQGMYDTFDKVLLLYEGRQIYFGPTHAAKAYFTNLGFLCPENVTTADFLTSLTHPSEAAERVAPQFSGRVPITSIDFAAAWDRSQERRDFLEGLSGYTAEFPISDEAINDFGKVKDTQRSSHLRKASPYTISFLHQIWICFCRASQRFQTNIAAAISNTIGNFILSVVIGSVFYNLPETASSLLSRSILLFYITVINAFITASEVLLVWGHRPIVEKQRRYAFYRPIAESISSMLSDLPNKVVVCLALTMPAYFLSNLRRTPSAYLTFFLFSIVSMMTLSMFFRLAGSLSRSVEGSIVPNGLATMIFIIYTGFILPVPYMLPWLKWVRFLNPIYFALESIMINEFNDRVFDCAIMVPSGGSYSNLEIDQESCASVGVIPGQSVVSGDLYIKLSYGFDVSNFWRNLGILFIMLFGFCALHLVAAELIPPPASKGVILQFPRGLDPRRQDIETSALDRHTIQAGRTSPENKERPQNVSAESVLQWQDVSYRTSSGTKSKTILNTISGYIQAGSMTALMGVTGAGKTTLLDVLAGRTNGEITGDILMNGKPRGLSFQRNVGYVQQQDIHLQTSTVREALLFSSTLRRPANTPDAEHVTFVEEVIDLLEMRPYADAIVGSPGEGLNIEQRKRLTIAVEMVAKPSAVLFLGPYGSIPRGSLGDTNADETDEPTSGLDSQTAWSICNLLHKLSRNGQAILCTIHQPSSSLLEFFDRVLLLGNNGRQLYFGNIGSSAQDLTTYFTGKGARPCAEHDNPAEWMFDVTSNSNTVSDTWDNIWTESSENRELKEELNRLQQRVKGANGQGGGEDEDEFATSLAKQFKTVTHRTLKEFWRYPSYLWAKILFCGGVAILIGVSLWMSPQTIQGVQSQLFSIFLLASVCNSGINQIIPAYQNRRTIFEARERPSKIYSWKVFMLSSIVAEIPWQTLTAIVSFVLWYYPVGMFQNARGDGLHERGILMFLFVWALFLFMNTFAHFVAASIGDAQTAVGIAILLYQLVLLFCGVLVAPSALPRFWIFMYRISPLTYMVSGMMSTGIANVRIRCSSVETVAFNPPSGQTCGEYLAEYLAFADGQILNPDATSACQFCPLSSTNSFLNSIGIDYATRWRDFGIFMAYIVFNALFAMCLYRLVRVPKRKVK